MNPVGIILIVGFAAILVWAVMKDKKQSGQFKEEILKRYDGKKLAGNDVTFITNEGELVMLGNLRGAAICDSYKLDNVAYVMTCYDRTPRSWVFALYDANKKVIYGQQFASSKKQPTKKRAYVFTDENSVNYMWELVHSQVPSAKRVGMYFKDIV